MAVKLGYNEPKTPGYFQNTQYGLFVPFQFSPTEMHNSKTPNYSQEPIPGLDFQPIIWTSGGPYVLSFKISFDHRPDHAKPGAAFGNISSTPSRSQKLASNGANLARNSAQNSIPEFNTIKSLGNSVKAISGAGIPTVDLNLLDTSKYVTVDGKEYNENLGCLPQIAALQSFLRPIDTSEINNRDQYKLGNLQQTLATIKAKNNTSTNRKFVGTPDCFYHSGNRVWRTKMMVAQIDEVIYNQKLVPVRIDVDVQLNVIEAYSYEDYLSANATRLTLAFSLGDKSTASSVNLGNSVTF